MLGLAGTDVWELGSGRVLDHQESYSGYQHSIQHIPGVFEVGIAP